jgi:glycosyltransferase involved in cell wall biosynthesis
MEFGSILCFANIPPMVKPECKVYTYFHNINLLKIPSEFSLKGKAISFLKRLYISFYSRNTHAWIVQTQNTENYLRKVLPCKGKQVLQMPFYRGVIPSKEELQRKDYILVGDYTGTRGHDELLKAWEILKGKGVEAVLHFTVSKDSPFSEIVDSYIKNGVAVINHGIIPFEEVCKLYHRCKATVYPSLNESLGLGIIEAIDAGCDVLGVDLPYVHSVCNPTLTFKNVTPEEIAASVLSYEEGGGPKTTLNIQNKIDDLITCLIK